MSTTADAQLISSGRNGWPLFIVLSLLFHLAVLALWHLATADHTLQSSASAAPFAVLLEGAAPSAQTRTVQPREVQPPAAQHVAKKKTATTPPRVATANVPAPAATPSAPAVAVAPQPSRVLGTSLRLLDSQPGVALPREDDGGELHQQIEALIRARLAEHFVYPRLAQQQGWQGEVLLAFRVGVDGTLSHIEIANSSGHAILDEAALDAMRQIERIELSGIVLRRMLELRMPVIYRLAQG